jgi:NADPH:quinone reductase-like Zn-dependent oxidoreductase
VKAVIYRKYGGPDVLEITDVPRPVIRGDQILVRVRASSVNPVDWKFRSGKPRIPFLKMPRVPGLDVCGEVVEVGSSVSAFQPGDEIFAMLSAFAGGGCAEYAAVPARQAAAGPRNLSFREAAAVPLAALTALQALRDDGGVQPGHRVLINGASGGVGSFAVQIARILGAEVTAVAGGKNRDFVLDLGALRAIDYETEDFADGDSRYDIIFDAVSSRSFRECRRVLNPKGIYLSTLPKFSTAIRMVTGLLLGGKRSRIISVRPVGADLDILRRWIEEKKMSPRVDRVYPIEKTGEAQAFSEAGHARGKIVIEIGGGEPLEGLNK